MLPKSPSLMNKVWRADYLIHLLRYLLWRVVDQGSPYLSLRKKLGASIGLALTSVVLDKTIAKKAHSLGIFVPPGGAASDNVPPAALLAGYRAAQWFNFAFLIVALVLAVVFLRDIGVIARKHPEPRESRAGGTGREEKLDEEAVMGLERPAEGTVNNAGKESKAQKARE